MKESFIPFVFSLLLLFSTSAASQTAGCKLKLADLPPAAELMGFQMGMTKDQVKARVPQVAFGRTDDLGVSKTTINPDFDPKIDKASFGGVRSVSLDFLDQRLTSLWLGYDSTFKWKTVEDFVAGISSALKLPDAWEPWRTRGQQLRCVDFVMTVNIIAEGPSFRIIDQAAEDQLVARREAKEEAESATTEAGDAAEETAEDPVLADNRHKIYYPTNCPPSKPIAGEQQTIFKSITDAEKAGYKKAKNCP